MDDFLSVNYDIIKEKLNSTSFCGNIYFFDKATSTFDLEDKTQKKDRTLIIAKTQTNAYGRFKRKWQSDSGGVYFSLIIRPDKKCDLSTFYSIISALCVKRAISKHLKCFVKWPNDIIDKTGKKLCGILTKVRYETDDNFYLNIGIGINANTSDFPSELVYATSIFKNLGYKIDENLLLKDIITEFESLCNEEKEKIIKEYKDCAVTLGKDVKIISPNDGSFYIAKCIDINSDGALIVETQDKVKKIINYGEVSVRGIYDGI